MPFSRPTSHTSAQPGSIVVVGAGRMGKNHLAAIARGDCWRLAGVFDGRPELGGGVTDLEAWLRDRKPEAAIVAVPPEVHDEVARTCLAAGCHVLLEKPLCPSAEAARRLAEAFVGADRVLFGGHTERFNPVFKTMVEQRGRIGSLLEIRTWRVGPRPGRIETGGVVLDLAIHDLDLALRLGGRLEPGMSACVEEGGEVVEVRASLAGVDVGVEVFAKWDGARRRGVRLVGMLGVLEADLLGRKLTFLTENVETEIDVVWSDPLEAEHAAFFAACRGEFDSAADLEPQIGAIGLAQAVLADSV